jgi:hypothetical protein
VADRVEREDVGPGECEDERGQAVDGPRVKLRRCRVVDRPFLIDAPLSSSRSPPRPSRLARGSSQRTYIFHGRPSFPSPDVTPSLSLSHWRTTVPYILPPSHQLPRNFNVLGRLRLVFSAGATQIAPADNRHLRLIHKHAERPRYI